MKNKKIQIKSLNDTEIAEGKRLETWCANVICEDEAQCNKFMIAVIEDLKTNYGGGAEEPEYSFSGRYEQDIACPAFSDHDRKSDWIKDLRDIAKGIN